jgi:hypothetical protein
MKQEEAKGGYSYGIDTLIGVMLCMNAKRKSSKSKTVYSVYVCLHTHVNVGGARWPRVHFGVRSRKLSNVGQSLDGCPKIFNSSFFVFRKAR